MLRLPDNFKFTPKFFFGLAGLILLIVTLPVITGKVQPDLKTTEFLINLFHDKNGDGIKQDGEGKLPWAGVTFRLTPVK